MAFGSLRKGSFGGMTDVARLVRSSVGVSDLQCAWGAVGGATLLRLALLRSTNNTYAAGDRPLAAARGDGAARGEPAQLHAHASAVGRTGRLGVRGCHCTRLSDR